MDCDNAGGQPGKDGVELVAGPRLFDLSATAWLVNEAIRHLNASDEEGALAYRRVIELLTGRNDAVETITQLAWKAPVEDVPLRWNLLYLAGEVADGTAAEFLVRTALAPLPAADRNTGCEGPRDGELLVRTMAVEALLRIARRHAEVRDSLLRVVSESAERPILIEAVKAAKELGLADKVREILRPEHHWMLDIRRARIEEVAAEPERQDTKERGFTPPKLASASTTPSVACQCRKEK